MKLVLKVPPGNRSSMTKYFRLMLILNVSILLRFQFMSQMPSANVIRPAAEISFSSQESVISRNNKVIILGPHDRYNFGDLLFSKVIAKLLVSHAGYTADDILYGGIVSVNASSFGGPETVLSMKRIQALSRNDTLHGPYDIIYAGGEALGCPYRVAVIMMPTQQLRQQARREKIHECAYLFPKSLLLPDGADVAGTNDNYAIINSLGGSVNNECAEAVATANYVSYRDKPPFFPDSAVMTRELFSKDIDQGARRVLRALKFTEEKKFLAVQHKAAGKVDTQVLAEGLDRLGQRMNATVVFFAAGTVTYHDSFELYEKVKSKMKADAIVYKGEHVWDVVGLISRAEAVLSSSLHVRIMAFIHQKPRVNVFACEDKHKLFFQLWETKTSPPCFKDILPAVDALLEYYFAKKSAASQNDTHLETYNKLVLKYQLNFFNYARLLRPQMTSNMMLNEKATRRN